MEELDRVLKTFIVCAAIVLVIFSMSSCTSKIIEHENKHKTDFEKCVDSCPMGWTVDRECLNRCFDIEESRGNIVEKTCDAEFNFTTSTEIKTFEKDCKEIGGEPWWTNEGFRSCEISKYDDKDIIALTNFCKAKGIDDDVKMNPYKIDCYGII